jgi:hypothetical protein
VPETQTKPALASLVEHLKACETVTDLFKLANSDAFKSQAHALAADDLKTLRDEYRTMQTTLDGKVKLAAFDGQTLRIVNVEWWHSETWDNEGVTLHFRPESDPTHKYKALTSSVVIVRFCGKLADVPTEDAPIRVQIRLVPVRDPARAAKGQTIFSIKRLPMPELTPSGSPF